MRGLAASAVSFVPDLEGAHARRLLPPAGLAVLGLLLVLGTDVSEPDGVTLDVRDPSQGETIVSKIAKAAKAAKATRPAMAASTEGFEPTSASRLLTMALAPALPQARALAAGTETAEPNLQGLSEIPKELIWNRPPEEDDDKEKRKAFAAFAAVGDNLPWGDVEPVPFSPLEPAASPARTETVQPTAAAAPRHTAVAAPGRAEVKQWLKSKVTEIKGSARARPLYHFELWLEPPVDVKRHIVGVTYAFNSPAIRPQSQVSSDKTSGFRISAGGLACADEVMLTLRFDNGSAHTVALDGCKLLS